jgi:hypothetical protein
MENDYWDITRKEKVDEILVAKGFHVVLQQAGGWGPCQNRFFEVWSK